MIVKSIKGIKYRLDEENLTAEVLQKKGYKGDFIIPETVVLKKVAYRVTSIGDWAFYGCSSRTSIVIPDSVTRPNAPTERMSVAEVVELAERYKAAYYDYDLFMVLEHYIELLNRYDQENAYIKKITI